MYKVTVITTTGQIVPEIPCDDYKEFFKEFDGIITLQLSVDKNEAIEEVAKFYNPQGYIVKEVDNG